VLSAAVRAAAAVLLVTSRRESCNIRTFLCYLSHRRSGVAIIHDVNGDGISDAILADYDGGIYFVGLQVGKDHRRYFHKARIPRFSFVVNG
jgi:hypothetical protein